MIDSRPAPKLQGERNSLQPPITVVTSKALGGHINQGGGLLRISRPYRCVYHVLKVVVSVLSTANSSYLASFNSLSQRITEGSMEANNNLKFLESITTPCQNVRVLETIQSW